MNLRQDEEQGKESEGKAVKGRWKAASEQEVFGTCEGIVGLMFK
jgi:hypothetical protein